jgi:hypothetical protein
MERDKVFLLSVIDIQYAKHTWFLAVMAFPVPGAGCSADSK